MDFIDPFSVSKHCEVFLWAELSWRQKESTSLTLPVKFVLCQLLEKFRFYRHM